jgi:hypothetical protein
MARKGKLGQKQAKEAVERPVRFKKYEYLFLIVCEDQNTEPTYFEYFAMQLPEDTMYVRPVGAGLDPKGVAEKAVEEKRRLEIEANRSVDYVWIVFDIDDADMNEARYQRFREAFEIGQSERFKIAWTNEVFELWLLLHLTDVPHTPGLGRQEVYQRIHDQIRLHHPYEEYVYQHPDVTILEKIRGVGNEEKAIARAIVLSIAHQHREPINANPCTKVHLLVIELRKWIAYYSYDPNNV